MKRTEPIQVAHVTTTDLSLRFLLLNQLKQYRRAGYSITGVSRTGPDVPTLEAAGIRHIHVPLTRALGPFADLWALIALYDVFRREKFTVVHTHTPKGGLLGQYAALLARVPLRVHTIHGLYFPGTMKPSQRALYVWLERLTMMFSRYNFSQNPEDIPVAIQEKISKADRIELVGNGINLSHFDPERVSAERRAEIRASLGLAPHHKVVGMVARLVEEKGYLEIFEAARMLRSKEPDARFIFVGGFEPEKKDRLDAGVLARFGIEDIAQLLGHRSDVADLYAIMDVCVLPSHREGFPRSPMEASAMGVPCVVTDVRGCRQTVDDGVTGYMVPVKNPPALAEAIGKLLANAEHRKALGRGARAKAIAEFDERAVIDKILRAYDRLLHEMGIERTVSAEPESRQNGAGHLHHA